jgi:hypothetical protein
MLPTIVHARPPARAKAAKKLRPPPACGFFVTAKHPKQIAALRMRSEVLKADPVPPRRSIGTLRKATAAEIQECLRFAGHADVMVSKIAIERLLDHIQACGFVLMKDDH